MIFSLFRAVLSLRGWLLAAVPRGQVIPPELQGDESYARPEDFSRLYRPWRGAEFLASLHPGIRENTMLSPQKLYTIRQLLLTALSVPGDIFEAGTCSGGTARLMLDLVQQQGRAGEKQLWLLDTYAGYQKVDRTRDGSHAQLADCRGKSKEEVARLLAEGGAAVHIVAGLIPATLAEVHTQRLCFAHIDVNLHEPTAAATEFCLERLSPGGIMVFDDYNWPATYGARQAIDEVVARRKQTVVCLPESTQAFLVRTG